MKMKIANVIFCICTVILLVSLDIYAAELQEDPDNAALVYYQAFLNRQEPNEAVFFAMEDVTRGAEPNENVRKYLNLPYTKETIKFAQSATRISQCDWGPLYSQGYYQPCPAIFINQSRRLETLLRVYARTLAADGDYRSAFEQCLTLRRFAAHIGDNGFYMFSTSKSINVGSLNCIGHILGSMPPDVEALTWLKNQLLTVEGTPFRPEQALKLQRDLELQLLRTHHDTRAWRWKEDYPEAIEDENIREELLLRARNSYDEFLESALEIIGSRRLFNEKQTEILKLTDKYEARAINDDDPISVLWVCVNWLRGYHRLMVGYTASFNSTMTAIDIYIEIAKTGKLPEVLSKNSPKDPFSNQEFEYEITDDGFILKCRVIPVGEPKIRQYEFKVKGNP